MEVKYRLNKKELEKFSKNFVKSLDIGDIVFLIGDLGSGKSTIASFLIKAIFQKYNVSYDIIKFGEICSPTFNIVHQYKINNDIKIHHYDLYRIKEKTELFELDLQGAINSGILIVEWPEIARNFFPSNNIIEIQLLFTEYKNIRNLIIKNSNMVL